jgi:hypothetical protein
MGLAKAVSPDDLAAEVGFGIVEGFHGDRINATLDCKSLGIASGLAANKKRDLVEFL